MMNRTVEMVRSEAAIIRAMILTLVLLFCVLSNSGWAADATNKLLSVDIQAEVGTPIVKIETEKPVGYRYTVYDSIDPVRVVIDFPGMDVSELETPDIPDVPPIKDIKITSFDLTSGKLGRIEVILDQSSAYDVVLSDTLFTMSFEATEPAAVAAIPGPSIEPDVAEVTAMEEPAAPPVEEESTREPEPVEPVEPVVEKKTTQPMEKMATATVISDVSVGDSSLTLNSDGHIEIYKYFKLGAPPRLVVDVYGVDAGFKGRKFALANGFKQMRVGTYKDKTRFVLDASAELPEYSVVTRDNSVRVAWGKAAGEEPAPAPPRQASGVPVNVEAVDFDIENGHSVVRVTLSGSPTLIEPSRKNDIIGFGVKNATISRSLRRAIDASSFPSSIRLITPYTVLVGESQDVRFAVELKGPSEYAIDSDANVVTLKVENGPFAEPEAPMGEKVAVRVPAADTDVKVQAGQEAVSVTVAPEMAESAPAPVQEDIEAAIEREAEAAQVRRVTASQEIGYSGQRISLVFDNADIRNILQLIAEVSNLNILAGDGVDGTITLRLIDVPWDQALDLILETKDLGMIRDGNVARILPKESIRAMDEAKFTAERTKEKLEDLVTEVVSVSYTDLKNVAAPARDLLTDRGKITEDSRNKQIIVTDIASVIDSVKNLVSILDTPEKQVLIEARIVEVNTDTSFELGINWNVFYSQDASFDPDVSNQNSQVGFGGDFVIQPGSAGTGFQPGIGSVFSWGRVGVDTTILDLRLSALETAGDGRVVSNPRIMTLNGEKAKISQGTMIPYQSSDGDTVKTELVEAALSLEVTPIVNPDNSVIIDVLATNSTPGASLGGLTSIDKKEAQTKMLVKDGETMVIGGVYVEQQEYSERGVPILMNVPFLGQLFRSTRTSTNRAELMVFITPRIIE